MVSLIDVSVVEVEWRKAGGGEGGEGAADTALKTKTPHDNVGNNTQHPGTCHGDIQVRVC